MHDGNVSATQENSREKEAEFDTRLAEMRERVARRPKLFQQTGLDVEVERAKQAKCGIV